MPDIVFVERQPEEPFREYVYRLMERNHVRIARTGRESAGTLPHVSIDVVGITPEMHTPLLVFCRAALSSGKDPDADLEAFQYRIMCILLDGSDQTLPHEGWRQYAPSSAFDERPRTKVEGKAVSKPRVLTTLIPVEEA